MHVSNYSLEESFSQVDFEVFSFEEDFEQEERDNRDYLQRYIEDYILPFKTYPYHLKTKYELGFNRSYHCLFKKEAGYITKNTGLIRRHLGMTPIPGWLGLLIDENSLYDQKIIDHDNSYPAGGKRIISIKKTVPELVIVSQPLEFFQTAKRVYDAFPGYTWHISSQSLGLHIRKKIPLTNVLKTYHELSDQLKLISPKLEAHPFPCKTLRDEKGTYVEGGRCLRAFGGRDYKTIAPGKVISDWREQLDFCTYDAQTPSFDFIVNALINEKHTAWNEYNCPHLIKPFLHEEEEIYDWLDKGCPPDIPVSVSVCLTIKQSEPKSEQLIIKQIVSEPNDSKCLSLEKKPNVNFDVIDLRNQNYAKGLCRLSEVGLIPKENLLLNIPCKDIIYTCAYEFSKYAFHYLYHPEDCSAFLKEWLLNWLFTKHNNLSKRIINGQIEEIERQINDAIEKAKTANNKNDIFSKMRLKKEKGLYKEILNPFCSSKGSLSPCITYISVGDSQPERIPETLLKELKERGGRKPKSFVNFAIEVIKFLKNGPSNISQETFCEFLGYHDMKQVNNYKKRLGNLIIWDKEQRTGYSKGYKSKRYMLSAFCLSFFS